MVNIGHDGCIMSTQHVALVSITPEDSSELVTFITRGGPPIGDAAPPPFEANVCTRSHNGLFNLVDKDLAKIWVILTPLFLVQQVVSPIGRTLMPLLFISVISNPL
ncbi:hypothetical protein AVEN_88505-1 [Araneus ventricosus]|uniref:Uncharacterized protein n=1 Tax=Araneus ventricosus TaxID=182803 RepID=A0A4Y2HQY5_ARAVE|nr:hypothetical protein AVEN_88505-1 [Araneus ventricosus]